MPPSRYWPFVMRCSVTPDTDSAWPTYWVSIVGTRTDIHGAIEHINRDPDMTAEVDPDHDRAFTLTGNLGLKSVPRYVRRKTGISLNVDRVRVHGPELIPGVVMWYSGVACFIVELRPDNHRLRGHIIRGIRALDDLNLGVTYLREGQHGIRIAAGQGWTSSSVARAVMDIAAAFSSEVDAVTGYD